MYIKIAIVCQTVWFNNTCMSSEFWNIPNIESYRIAIIVIIHVKELLNVYSLFTM